MPKRKADGTRPRKNELRELSVEQAGYFSLSQARDCGISKQLLQYMISIGEVVKELRGLYRWAHYPTSEEDELILFWLWSNCEGIYTHETALFLYQLSDLLPVHIHMTLPLSWRRKRLKLPGPLKLHYASIQEEDKAWFGSVQITKPLKTIADCAREHLSPEWLSQAITEALERGLFTMRQLRLLEEEEEIALSYLL